MSCRSESLTLLRRDVKLRVTFVRSNLSVNSSFRPFITGRSLSPCMACLWLHCLDSLQPCFPVPFGLYTSQEVWQGTSVNTRLGTYANLYDKCVANLYYTSTNASWSLLVGSWIDSNVCVNLLLRRTT